jgi:diguanylate cyclase (GGDEF)-like protein
MREWEDYYKVLQVHFMAEPEIIQIAYKKLSKKYHPDVNKTLGAEKAMKAINKAYEILSDPIARKEYTIRWMEKYSGFNSQDNNSIVQHQIDFSIEPTKRVLEEYLDLISRRKLESAFEFISEIDKKNISKKDFVRWQTVVSEVFKLKKFECFVKNVYSDITINNCFFKTVIDFHVKIIEINNVMGRIEQDEFSKSVVLENNAWRIFLGYKELGSIISRFDELAKLKKQKLANRKKIHKQPNIDFVSGLLNKKGFTEKAEVEQIRYNRYGNKFSIILCEIDDCEQWAKIRYKAIKQVGEIIRLSLRELDISCRWKGKKFIILLPETPLATAIKVASKIQNKNHYSLSFVVKEQEYSTLNELIKAAE